MTVSIRTRIITFRIMTFSIRTRIITFRIMTFSIRTFSITTLSIITTLDIMSELFMPNVMHAKCRKKPLMLSVIMLDVILMSVVMLSVVAAFICSVQGPMYKNLRP
jgi:hypothetical protein